MGKFLKWLFSKEKEKLNTPVEEVEIPEEPKYDFRITFGNISIIEDWNNSSTLHTKVSFEKLRKDFETDADFFMAMKFDYVGDRIEVKFFRKQTNNNFRALWDEDVYYTERRIAAEFDRFDNVCEEFEWKYTKGNDYTYKLKEGLKKIEVKGFFNEVTSVKAVQNLGVRNSSL